ncbi:MAG: hypothetical protein ISS00_03220 [Candidatus Marinimicrobia bacterium]|nr:hypothetical protein [Candidatus Neomarinimicrobiota bacterium]
MNQQMMRYFLFTLQAISFLAFVFCLIAFSEIIALLVLTLGILLWVIAINVFDVTLDKRQFGLIWLSYGFITSFVLLFVYAIEENMWGAISWNLEWLCVTLFVMLLALSVASISFFLHKQDERITKTHEILLQILEKAEPEQTSDELDI